jgi:hypothetical protein
MAAKQAPITVNGTLHKLLLVPRGHYNKKDEAGKWKHVAEGTQNQLQRRWRCAGDGTSICGCMVFACCACENVATGMPHKMFCVNHYASHCAKS